MTFPEKPTTKDVSEIPENQDFPAYHSSMAGGNMVTDKSPYFAGQGADSEGSHDVIAHNVDYVGFSHPTPVLPGPVTPESELDTDEKGSGYSPSPLTWKVTDSRGLSSHRTDHCAGCRRSPGRELSS